MAREKGNALSCLRKLIHHVYPRKALLMAAAGALTYDIVEYRNSLVREEAEIALKQLERIREIAKDKGYQEIIDVIEEQVEFGHEF